MIEFMVLSAPRSGSTWTSNWLTTEKTLCLHDPVLEYRLDELEQVHCDRMLGVACTGLALVPKFVNAHPARKVVVHRDFDEVNLSLRTIGATDLGPGWDGKLESIAGMHVAYEDLFDAEKAGRIYEYLTRQPFDAPRHAQLVRMHVEPQFDLLPLPSGRAKDFVRRILEELMV